MNSLERITTDEAQKLSKQATQIDLMDFFTGPISSLCMCSDSEYLFQFGAALSLAELLFVKTPYLLKYTYKTGDTKGLLYLGLKEVAANVVKMGGFFDIVPAYVLRAKYTLRDKL
jgi:hypothetical protein